MYIRIIIEKIFAYMLFIFQRYVLTTVLKKKINTRKNKFTQKQCNKSFNGSKGFVGETRSPTLPPSKKTTNVYKWMMRAKRKHQALAFIYNIKNYICTLLLAVAVAVTL